MAVRVDLNISLDGYATTEGGTPDNPFGADWTKLTAAYAATPPLRTCTPGCRNYRARSRRAKAANAAASVRTAEPTSTPMSAQATSPN